METEKALLGVVDFIIFALMLLVSASIGVYFRFSGGKQKTTEEYLLAGKDMSILPVAFSLMASFLSAITVIGVPAEVYQFGIHMAYMNLGYAIGAVISAYISLPIFFELNASTAYEYLDKRFGKVARTVTSVTFIFQMILFMSVVLYAPALALNAVTNLPIWISIISVGVVCTFYCTLGGMKAVLWTDVFQAVLMFIGIFAVLIKGLMDMGISEIYRIAYSGGRLESPGFGLNFTKRYTFWAIFLNGMVLSILSYSANQVQVQRLVTLKNVQRSRLSLFTSIPMGVSFHLLNCFTGIVIYANYAKCDPLTKPNNPISSPDQLLPYYMMSALGAFPGLPGLCICGIFSASLSTVSSAVNSLTAVTMQDLIRPFLVSRGFSQSKMAFSAKIITLFYGLLCVVLTFVIAALGNLVQASLTVFGMLGGPVLSIFLLGMFSTRANQKGAVFGLLTAVSIAAWLSFGSSAHAPPLKPLPVSLAGCSVNASLFNGSPSNLNASDFGIHLPLSVTSLSAIGDELDDISPVYKISFFWFAVIGLLVGLVVGYIASIAVNFITGKTAEVPQELLSPVFKYIFMRKKTNGAKNEMKISAPIELENADGTAANGVTLIKSREKDWL